MLCDRETQSPELAGHRPRSRLKEHFLPKVRGQRMGSRLAFCIFAASSPIRRRCCSTAPASRRARSTASRTNLDKSIAAFAAARSLAQPRLAMKYQRNFCVMKFVPRGLRR